jgi:hypothetical protein
MENHMMSESDELERTKDGEARAEQADAAHALGRIPSDSRGFGRAQERLRDANAVVREIPITRSVRKKVDGR